MSNSNTYFADLDSKECAALCMQRSATFYTTLQRNAYLEKLRSMWLFYHGIYANLGADEHQISFGGEQGEIVNIPINHFRNIAEHIINMITSNRPMMEARAVNNDYKSLSQANLAGSILDYYMRNKGIEDKIHASVEKAVVMGCGYIKLEWNATAGAVHDVNDDTGEFIYEGEIECSGLSPFDVVMDGTKESWDNEWLIARSFKNRHNLVAKYPEFKDEILALQTKSDDNRYSISMFTNDRTDDIPVYEFYHKRTEAKPDGRYMLYLSDNIILMDTKLVYREIPIYRLAMSEIMGTPYAYTNMFDVYPIQEAINGLNSTILTNQNATGIQSLWVQKGSDFNLESVIGGMNLIESETKPEPIQLTATAPETFNYLKKLEQDIETISGINAVTRGNPASSLRSGNSLALVQAMSLQYMSKFQKNYVTFIEQVGTSLLNILKDFASTPKLMEVVGRNNRAFTKEFTGDMIKDINRVVVDVGNPLSRSTAGRVQMAEQLLQMKLIKNPQQYFMVMNTGRLDNMYDSDMNQLLLVKKENEDMLDGKKATAALLDAHRMHIIEHQAVSSDPELRQNAELVANLYEHIQEHINFLRTADPDLLQLINETPLNPPQQAGNPIPPENMPPQSAVENSPMNNVMSQQGGAQQNAGSLPGLPKVDSALLPNSALNPNPK